MVLHSAIIAAAIALAGCGSISCRPTVGITLWQPPDGAPAEPTRITLDGIEAVTFVKCRY